MIQTQCHISYLLASSLVSHEHRRHAVASALTRLGLAARPLLSPAAAVQLHVLLYLGELEEALLIQLDPLLQDTEQHLQRRVLQRRLHHVQQRLVLDEPLLLSNSDVR